jgi:RNA polymerase sigma factor (sigma-70 family)
MQDRKHDIEFLLSQAGWLRGLARRLAGEAAADDLVQEVWLRVASRPPGSLRSPRGWLASVLRSAHLRRTERRTARAERERDVALAEALASAGELAERADAQHVLVAALLELEEPLRRTLLLHFFEGISAAEIARRDGQPASTVRSRIARGVEELRDRLDQRHGGRDAWLPGAMVLGWPKRSARASTPAAVSTASSTLLPLSAVIMWKPVALVSLALAAWFAVSLVTTEPSGDLAAAVTIDVSQVEPELAIDTAAAAQAARSPLGAKEDARGEPGQVPARRSVQTRGTRALEASRAPQLPQAAP